MFRDTLNEAAVWLLNGTSITSNPARIILMVILLVVCDADGGVLLCARMLSVGWGLQSHAFGIKRETVVGVFKVSGRMFSLHFLVVTFDLIGRDQLNE
jgi:hypothetical protein